MPSTLERPETQKAALPEHAQAAWQTLETRVEGVRRRHRTKFVVSGVCIALAIFAAAFLGFSFVDVLFKLSVGSRIFWLALTAGGVLAALFLAVIRPLSRLGGQVPMAREVERKYPELEEQLSTAIEYGRDPALGANGSSPELVGALIAQAKNRSDALDFKRTVNWRRAALAALCAFLVSAGVALYAGLNPRLFSSTWQRFMHPTAAIAPPTMTLIKSVERIDDGKAVAVEGEVPVETSVPILVTLDGRVPDTVTLSVLTGEGKDARWEDRIMDRGEDGLYRATLRRLLDTVKFRVKAGDAESNEFTLNVFREPQIDEFTVQLDYPKYTGKPQEILPPGQGDVKALRGTLVTVRFKGSSELGSAQCNFESGRPPAAARLEGRTGAFTFTVDKDDHYQIALSDSKGRASRSSTSYRVQSLKDLRPRVMIKKPERDLMVYREQTVKVEIAATDDVGVGEIGIFHSLGLEEKKTMVKRFEPAPTRGEGTLKWELSTLNLKGGEVIAYYAYALDNDTVDGPKMAKSEIQFLTIYDEEKLDGPQQPGGHPPTPHSIKQLDKLIEVQKKLLQETFAQARLRDEANAKEPDERAKSDAAKTSKAQRSLKEQLDGLMAEVKKEMERIAAEADKPEGEGNTPPQPQQPAMGETEFKHLETASTKMEGAAKELDQTQVANAVNPEVEALRHLSEARRLLLSDKEGDPRFKQAMQNQSKKKKKSQQEQDQQDQQAAREEMAQLPPMMEREKETERELDQLEDLSKKPPPPAGTPEAAQRKEEERKLKREAQDKLDQLAKEAKEREKNIRELAKRNAEMEPAADKMQQAGDKLDQAQKELDKDKIEKAKDLAHEAQRDMKDAQRSMRDALDKQFRQELANLQQDAQELAQKQEQLAEASRDQQRQQDQQQDDPKQGDPKQGDPKQGDPKQGQPQQGDPKQGQPQQGDPKQGQPQQGGKPDEKAMRQMGALGQKQQELSQDMKELSERLSQAAEKAQHNNMPGAESLKEAEAHTKDQSPGQKSAEKAASQLKEGKAGEAEHEQHKSTRALDAAAQAVQDARQKADAADMKALADAMQKAQALAKEQAEINKGLGEKQDPAKLAERQDKVGDAAKDLASAASKLETLNRQGRGKNAKEQLEFAAEKANEAAKEMAGQDTEKAKDPAAKTEKALQGAINEMERASGKSLEEKAQEAKKLAQTARDKQEKAAAGAKELPEPKKDQALGADDAAKRDEAAAQERNAARDAQKLEKALEGLEELAKDANPSAAQAAKDAKETVQENKVPDAMDELAKGLEKIGDPKKNAENPDVKAPSPQEAGKKGDELAKTLKKTERQIDQVLAEASNQLEEKLKNMEEAARDAAKKADELAGKKEGEKEDPKNPKNDPKGQTTDPKQPGDQKNPAAEKAAKLEKELKKLEPRLQQLEANAPEAKELKNAQQSLAQAKAEAEQIDPKNPANTEKKQGGPSFEKVSKSMEKIASGLMERRERILKAREVPSDGLQGDAPKEYRTLVDRYTQALSEDTEEKK
ncbi:MAG: hypothetical protein HY291_03940 [Planctomycetes bacterium]|nr:hypothetical protein [Planctomycetota bacterium]